MTDIVAFITARLDEDARLAEAAAVDAGSAVKPDPDWRDGGGSVVANGIIAYGLQNMEMDASVSAHIARHDPARVLAEVAAKRRILARHGATERGRCKACLTARAGRHQEDWDADPHPCDTLKLLAAPDADHPDYQAEWAIEA
jgi:hypothetical protein